MNVLRQQGRPKRGAMTVGRDRIILETLELLRRGETFASRKELALKIGITPALINYYFGSRCNLVQEHIVQLVEQHAERFRQSVSRHSGGCRSALTDALLIISRMYREDGPLLKRYADDVAAEPNKCAITQMKRDLASILATMSEEVGTQDGLASTMTAMLWAVCSTTREEECVATCVALVDRMIGARRTCYGVARDMDFLSPDSTPVLTSPLCVCEHPLDQDQRTDRLSIKAHDSFAPSSH